MPSVVYLSLGSNLGNREENLRTAIGTLAHLGTVDKVSSFYETEPVEFTDQPWFLNCAVQITTGLTPRHLLDGVLKIEQGMGRERLQPKGPRIIDIDILLFGDKVVSEPGMVIPHPAMHQRRFVLEPLAEIAPELRHPVLQESICKLLANLSSGGPAARRIS